MLKGGIHDLAHVYESYYFVQLCVLLWNKPI